MSKKITVISDKIYTYSKFEWNLAWTIVFLCGFIVGYLISHLTKAL